MVGTEAGPPSFHTLRSGGRSTPSGEVRSQEHGSAPRSLLDGRDPDGYFLIRYSKSGEFAGDTWHGAFEDATDQADDPRPVTKKGKFRGTDFRDIDDQTTALRQIRVHDSCAKAPGPRERQPELILNAQ